MDASAGSDASALLAESAWVRRLARALVRDPELADDIAQETLVAALERGAVDTPRTWLAAVLRNRARRAHRSDSRRVARERDVARAGASDSTDALVARAESHGRVVAAVLALDEPYRSVLLERYLEERTPAEIARRTGVPIATVKTRLQRGLARLRAQFDEGERRPAWLVALAGMRGANEVAAGLAVGGAIVTAKTALAGVVGLALACLVGLGIHALGAGDALGPRAMGEELAPVASSLNERATVGAEHERETSRAPLVAVASDDTGTANELEAGLARLTGVVVDSAERPIANARVDAFFDPGATYLRQPESERTHVDATETDELGRFTLALPAARAHTIEVRAAGFAPAQLSERTGGMQLLIVLERAASLRGTVVDERDGAPVGGGCVRVFHDAVAMVEVPVDANGRFELDEIAPGEVGLLARPEKLATARHRAFEVEPGGLLEVTLMVAPGLTVAGRITDARTGAPIAGAEVVSGVGAWKRARSGDDGRYRLEGVEAVRAETLFVRAAGYAGVQLALDPARADALDVALARGRAVFGRVVDALDAPVERGLVIAWTSDFLTGGGAPDELFTTLGADGVFRIADLDPALAYGLAVRAPGHATSYFPLDSGTDDVDVGVLRLAPAATLEGVVLAADGSPVRAMLELWPMQGEPGSSDGMGMRSFLSDAHGVFAVGDLGPGRYELRVGAGGLSRVDLEVTLGPGEHRRGFEVRLPGGLALRGMLRDPEGAPVEGAQVTAQPAEFRPGQSSVAYGKSDARGWFELAGLPPVPHELRVSLVEGWVLRGEPVELDALFVARAEPGGAPLELELVALDARVGGRVVDGEGAGVSQAYVWIERVGYGAGGGVLCDGEGRFELAVPSGAAHTLVARRTRHLAEGAGPMLVYEYEIGRHVAPADQGEARLTGVRADEGEVVLRLRP